MGNSSPSTQKPPEQRIRPAEQVMNIKRLGAMHQTPLSFMRRLIRQMTSQKWQITRPLWEMDENGFGTAVYRIKTPTSVYSHVLFSDYLSDEDRSDRVIAERWDVTMALCLGELEQDQLNDMRANVPLQEAGRMNANMVVLSRGNKSSRNFDYVVSQLANGKQPELERLIKVGYLYRTTAVYGSGKFGLADWQKVSSHCADLAYPFAAEMLSCYLLRQFSIEQAEHLASIKAPAAAVKMAPTISRYLGIGNATGLGMAPYLIRHPLLISSWMEAREKALAKAVSTAVTCAKLDKLSKVLAKAKQHLAETIVAAERQTKRYQTAQNELEKIMVWLDRHSLRLHHWQHLVDRVQERFSLETQELVNSALMEVHTEQITEQEGFPIVEEHYCLQPEMLVSEFKSLLNQHYRWALEIDFTEPNQNHYFWYASQEKMEPRLGRRGVDPGVEKELPLVIAKRIQSVDRDMDRFDRAETAPVQVARFLLNHPQHRSIVKRAQTMAQHRYGEIQVNLADADMLPLDLLRCKLSFFGVGKFDPKSDLWVRNTMFQGAPTSNELSAHFKDDWYFPVAEDFGVGQGSAPQ